ncbi:hypothetical protein CYMTET_34606, partial [Cymbomonas tetramitiformis]
DVTAEVCLAHTRKLSTTLLATGTVRSGVAPLATPRLAACPLLVCLCAELRTEDPQVLAGIWVTPKLASAFTVSKRLVEWWQFAMMEDPRAAATNSNSLRSGAAATAGPAPALQLLVAPLSEHTASEEGSRLSRSAVPGPPASSSSSLSGAL